MTTLWLRADGTASMGFGHVMRLVAVGQAARRRGIQPAFVIAHDPTAARLPATFGFTVVPTPAADDLAWLADVGSDDAVVFDGYHFDRHHYERARAGGARVASIQDHVVPRCGADVILNQNPVPAAAYAGTDSDTLLLGPRYALIRAEVAALRGREDNDAGTLLATFGASDPAGLGALLIGTLTAPAPFTEAVLVRGPAAPAVPAAPSWLRVLTDPPDVAEVFARASAAVSAAGITTWELLCLGVPCALVRAADNQDVVVTGLARMHAALDLGDRDTFADRLPAAIARLGDPATRARLTEAGRDLVDARGPERLLDALFASQGDSQRSST